MKVVILVAIFALAASQPHPRCSSPKQWEALAVTLIPGLNTFGDAIFSYDYINQRSRSLADIATHINSSKPTIEHVEYISNFNEKIQYTIFPDNKTCQKSPLSGSMPPIEVPATTNYIAQVWIGVEGVVGAGIETELWMGTTPGSYAGLWTQVECLPIMQTLNFNLSIPYYSHTTLYNVTLGIKDPNVFTPPAYCK